MAGNYPDVPGHRFALDKDGSALYRLQSGVVTQYTAAAISNMESNLSTAITEWNTLPSATGLLLYFPEPRTVTGIFLNATAQVGNTWITGVQYSTNTTNGSDGTWATLATAPAAFASSLVTQARYRDFITLTGGVSNVRAIRLNMSNSGGGSHSFNMHVYGEIPLTSNPNRLVLWHPSTDAPFGGAYLDWGDSPRSSSADRTFRVKNNSATLTASSIVLSLDALTDGSPSVAAMHLLSQDGTSFAATQNIGSLAPGAISPVQTLRRVLPSNAPLGVWAPRVHAVAGSWA